MTQDQFQAGAVGNCKLQGFVSEGENGIIWEATCEACSVSESLGDKYIRLAEVKRGKIGKAK